MELTFANKKLAETCNSRRLMAGRWGDDGFERVAERLLQLMAIRGLDDVSGLPLAVIEQATDGRVRIAFDGGAVVVTGRMPAAVRNGADGQLCIDRVDVMDQKRNR